MAADAGHCSINHHGPIFERLPAVLNVGDFVPHSLRQRTRLGRRIGLVQRHLVVRAREMNELHGRHNCRGTGAERLNEAILLDRVRDLITPRSPSESSAKAKQHAEQVHQTS